MATQSDGREHTNGISILSLDAGGPRGISQLEILRNIMDKLADDEDDYHHPIIKRPCEVFTVIGGTGTGGLIAILLVVLEMATNEALETFTDLVNKVFTDVDHNPIKQTERLNQAINDILIKHGVRPDTKLVVANGKPSTCRLAIPVVDRKNAGSPIILINYVDRRGPPVNLTIAEAMLATCASPPLFLPAKVIKDYSTFEYISADLGLSNPVREIIEGAHGAFGDETTVICILSLGSGHPGVNVAPDSSGAADLVEFFRQIALDGERKAQDMAIQMKKLTLYHRFSVPHGLETCEDEFWKGEDDIMAHTSNYLNDEEVARAMNQCVNTLKDGIGSVTLEQLKYIGGGDVLAPELLELTPNYVERKIPTEFLEKCLLNADGSIKPGSKRVIVTGMGGCGKTQLVRKFIENHGDLFVSVFFIDGSSKETIKRDFTEHVRALGGALSQKSFEESMRFLSLPVQGGERLLVMDNVDDPKVNISAFLPKWKRGAVIITSRNGSHGQLNPSGHLQLDVMSPDESTELLIRGSGSTQLSGSHQEAAAKVAEELGNLPIALVQAASYIFRTGCSDTTYVSLLKTSRERVLSDPATNQIDMRYTTAFAAFDASYSILPSKAQLMLHLLSFFHRQKLPVDCIGFDANNGFSYQEEYLDRGEEYERGREFLKEIFYSHGRWDPAEVESIIGSLRAHSLITVISTETTRLLQMHSLVHEWARLRVPSDEVVHFQDAAIRLLCCNAQESNYAMMQYLQLHVQALSYIWETMHVNDMESFGFILKESGDYSGCLRLRERLRSVLSDRLGVDHHFTIVTSVNLAATYRQLGRYAEAEVMFIEVVKQRTKLLGFNHLDTINASANLADIYRRLGRYAEAEALEVEVLKQRTRLLGVNHPDTLRASASLAATYIQLGRYVEAEVLDAQVLKWRTQMLGVDHLETIFASAGLAATYTQLGRHAEAEVLKVEVLNQRTKLLGVDHPDTIQATANLAVTYSQLSRHAEVERLQTDVLQRRTRLFGDRHPNTLLAMWSLASTYKAMKRHSEALELARKAHLGYGETLGDSHPYSQQVAALLASLTAGQPVNLG